MFELKGFLIGIGIGLAFALTVPWMVRLIDVWVDYKNWVLGL